MEQLKGWRGLSIKGALFLATIAFAMLSPRYVPFITTSENWASDWRISLFNPSEEPHSEIVILAITEDTLATFPYRFPVDRGFLADLVRSLEQKGARLVALDILFDQPTEAAKDERLRRILSNSQMPVVVGWTDRETGLTEQRFAFQKAYLDGVQHGFSNLLKDPDGTVRFGVSTVPSEGRSEISFSGRIATLLGAELPGEKVRLAYRGRPDDGKPVFPTYPSHVASKFPATWFKDKIVFVGADLPFEDRHRTPFAAELGISGGKIPGVEVQAHMLAQFLDQQAKDDENLVFEVLLTVLIALAAAWLTFSTHPAWLKMIEGLSAVGLLWAAAILLFQERGVTVPMVSPTLSFATVLGIGSAFVAYMNGQQARFIRGAFSRYLSPDMVAQVADEPDRLRLGGDRREMTLLFCDVRGFTSLSERLTPLELTRLLNRMLTPLTDIVLENKGTIDKYMGDCIMAFWNAPLDNGDHARDGCRSALLMLDAMDDFNAVLKREAEESDGTYMPLQIGFGLNSGECVVGNMGSEQRFDYSVLGDTVNTAARLEGQSKAYGVDIVIGEATQREVTDFATLELDLIQVKGKAQGIRIYALLGDEALARDETYQSLVSTHSEMLAAYRGQDWDLARSKVEEARAKGRSLKLDELYDMYTDRLDWYEMNPPSPVWDGVYVAETK